MVQGTRVPIFVETRHLSELSRMSLNFSFTLLTIRVICGYLLSYLFCVCKIEYTNILFPNLPYRSPTKRYVTVLFTMLCYLVMLTLMMTDGLNKSCIHVASAFSGMSGSDSNLNIVKDWYLTK